MSSLSVLETEIGDRLDDRASAAGARGLQAGLRALADQLALELGNRAEDAEHQPARRAGGVDAFREAAEAELPSLELADQLNEVAQ